MRSHIFLYSLLGLLIIGLGTNLVFTISTHEKQKNVQSELSQISSSQPSFVQISGSETSNPTSPIRDTFSLFCPPSGEAVQSKVLDFDQELYIDLYLNCADSNFNLTNHLLMQRVDGKFEEVLSYTFSNHALSWTYKNGGFQELKPIADIPWSEIDGFGGPGNEVEVYDVTLNGVEQNLLQDIIDYADGGLGGFQGATFELIDVTSGLLTWNEIVYEVDFENNSVSLRQ